jgi:hypothetical protein
MSTLDPGAFQEELDRNLLAIQRNLTAQRAHNATVEVRLAELGNENLVRKEEISGLVTATGNLNTSVARLRGEMDQVQEAVKPENLNATIDARIAERVQVGSPAAAAICFVLFGACTFAGCVLFNLNMAGAAMGAVLAGLGGIFVGLAMTHPSGGNRSREHWWQLYRPRADAAPTTPTPNNANANLRTPAPV